MGLQLSWKTLRARPDPPPARTLPSPGRGGLRPHSIEPIRPDDRWDPSPRHQPENNPMKIVVVGGSGRIGKKLVFNLRQNDYRVLEASPSFGVDATSGFGLDEVLEGAEILVDVSN